MDMNLINRIPGALQGVVEAGDLSGFVTLIWRKGEIGRFGAVTSKKLGSIPLSVRSATIKWSKNQSKLSVNAQLASSSAGSSLGYGDSDDDGMYGSFM